MKEIFSVSLRAEIEALITRYEALVKARLEDLERSGSRDADALRAEINALRHERDSLSRELSSSRTERDDLLQKLVALRSERDGLARDLAHANEQMEKLKVEAEAGAAAASALEEQFSAEKRFVASCTGSAGTMLDDALRAAIGRDLNPSPALYAALKAKGLEAVLVAAFKERGRTAAQAPLLEREKSALPALAAAAGCDLVIPSHGTRFSSSSMDKAATAIDPAEEGNVVECLLPGLRRSGTEGSLVFPRVRVATG
jgi:hypothetical protein